MKKLLLLPIVTFVSTSNNQDAIKKPKYKDSEILDESSELYELLAQGTLIKVEYGYSIFNSSISFDLFGKNYKYVDTITVNKLEEIADFLTAIDPSLHIGISYPIYTTLFLEESTSIYISTNNELKKYLKKCLMMIGDYR